MQKKAIEAFFEKLSFINGLENLQSLFRQNYFYPFPAFPRVLVLFRFLAFKTWKKLSPFLGKFHFNFILISCLISYPAETFAKKSQKREKRESFCP